MSQIFNKRVFVECNFRKPFIVSFKVQGLSKNAHSSLNKDLWVLFQLFKLAFEVWSGKNSSVLNISWGSRYSDIKRQLAVVIKCLFRSSTLTVKVRFFVLSIWWIKHQIHFDLSSLSAEVKNFFLIVHIACFNLFRTSLYAVQSEVFWVRCARYCLWLHSDLSCWIWRLFNQVAGGLVHFICFRGACWSIHSVTRVLKMSDLSSWSSVAYTVLNGSFWKSALKS